MQHSQKKKIDWRRDSDYEIKEKLTDKDFDWSDDDNGLTPVMNAALYGRAKIIRFMRDELHNCDIYEQGKGGFTAVEYAAIGGSVETVREVMASREANYHCHRLHIPDALTMAAYYGHTEVVKTLIDDYKVKMRANYPHFKWYHHATVTPVCFAAYNGHAETVKALIERGAELIVDNNGGYRADAEEWLDLGIEKLPGRYTDSLSSKKSIGPYEKMEEFFADLNSHEEQYPDPSSPEYKKSIKDYKEVEKLFKNASKIREDYLKKNQQSPKSSLRGKFGSSKEASKYSLTGKGKGNITITVTSMKGRRDR